MKLLPAILIFLGMNSIQYAQDTKQKDTVSVRIPAAAADSLAAPDSAASVKSPQPGIVRFHRPEVSSSYFISRNDIRYNDYRNTADLLSWFPGSFYNDLGYAGAPGEERIYGHGFGDVTFLRDNMPLNNRLSNTFDIYNMRSEAVDSIEIVRSPRAFLYGLFNNSSAVILHEKDRYSIRGSRLPYTRMRYYQAPNEEAMIDFIYNSYLHRRLLVTVGFMNMRSDSNFTNSGYTTWQGTAEVKYLLSDKFTISFIYDYLKSHVQLNYGLNRVGIIQEAGGDIKKYKDVISYYTGEPRLAPVERQDDYQNTVQNGYSLNMTAQMSDYVTARVKLFYTDHTREYWRYDPLGQSILPPEFKRFDYDYKNYGLLAEAAYDNGTSALSVMGGLDILRPQAYVSGDNDPGYYISAIYTHRLLSASLLPSVFAKHMQKNGNAYDGFGADLTYKINDQWSVYAGLSGFRKSSAAEPVSNADYMKSLMEGGINFSSGSTRLSVSLFLDRTDAEDETAIISRWQWQMVPAVVLRNDDEFMGALVSFDYGYGHFLLQTRAAWYGQQKRKEYMRIPEYNLRAGLYYMDILFNSNLRLKTGFVFRSTGSQSDQYEYAFDTMLRLPYAQQNSTKSSPVYLVDYTATGEIQERAVLYLTVENLFGTKYYITPFYPMPGTSVRLGLSWEFLN